MATLLRLEKRIETVHELESVVRTMKSLAAVNIRQYERAARSLDEFSRASRIGLRMFFSRFRGELPKADENKAVVLVLGSDQGMCGRFNEAALDRAEELDRRENLFDKDVRWWTAGERIPGLMEDSGRSSGQRFTIPSDIDSVGNHVEEVVERFVQFYEEERGEILYIVHNRVSQHSNFESDSVRLLPLDKRFIQSLREEESPTRALPMLGMEARPLFRSLFEQYLFIGIYRAFVQSMAAESAARLASMQAAESNIQEMEEELTAQYREERRRQITEELFDVISGFEALTE